MTNKKKIDPMSEAAQSTIEMEIKKHKIAETEQKKREKLIGKTYQMLGQIRVADMFAKTGNIAGLVWLKEVKEKKIYRDIDGMNSWESFCNHLGKSRRHVDRDLENLKVFGAEFLGTMSGLNIGYKDLKKLQKSVSDGDMTIEGDFVVIGEEKIPLSPDSKDDLEAAFEVLVEDRDRKIEESEVTMKAKDRVLAAKQKVIQQQEKELLKFTKEIENRDYEPGEIEFIKQMDAEKLVITGVFLKLDPERMSEDTTPLMTAKYMEVLAYIKRMAQAHYDAALETRAQPDDISWRQPGLDTEPEESNPEVLNLFGE